MENLFTFWEGPSMPGYIRLCIDTWHGPYKQIFLNYKNLNHYTDLNIEKLKRFTLPQIADIVRVHVLRDNGGYWLDADTIMLSDKLPEETIMGYPLTRANTIGFLHTDKQSDMFKTWAKYQDDVMDGPDWIMSWDVVGNKFTDPYLHVHENIPIYPVYDCWPEDYMIVGLAHRMDKYKQFYFKEKYTLSSINETDMLMLHNSWTPDWYKNLTETEVSQHDCTLSNILREVV